MKKIIISLCLAIIVLFSLTGCGSGGFMKEKDMLDIDKNPTGVVYLEIYDEGLDRVVMSKTFSFELYYSDAPITVTNFISLVNNEYYKGKTFELDEPFVLFGTREFVEEENEDSGDILYYRKTVEKAYNIKGEFANNGWKKNDQTSGVGSMIMIREENSTNPSSKYDTAYAAFKILTQTSNKQYEEDYCVFGKITGLASGKIEQLLVNDLFLNNPDISDAYDGVNNQYKFRISKIEIDTHGVTFPAPKTIKVKK